MQNVNLAYKLIYRKEAVKFLAKQEKEVQERIVIALQGLLYSPPQGDIKKMRGQQSLYRLRGKRKKVPVFRQGDELRIFFDKFIRCVYFIYCLWYI